MKINIADFIEQNRNKILKEVNKIETKKPKLVTFLIGDRKDSQVYVTNKEKEIAKCNMESETIRIKDGTPILDIMESIDLKAKDNNINGILIQLPLNREYYSDKDEQLLISCIPQEKDVDGLTLINQGKLFMGYDQNTFLTPCTPTGIIRLLKEEYNGLLQGRDIVVVGRSQLLGNSLAQMLMRENANVTILHSKSNHNIGEYINNNQTGTICLCAGVPNLLKAKDIKTEYLHTIIDAGINVGKDNKLRGDFCKEDYQELDNRNISYTTVPGGVGPITVHMLAYNLYKAYCLQNNIKLDI